MAPGDTVYHIGDFMCRGSERGVRGTKTTAAYWESQLNGKIIHIKGNHDKNNSVRYALSSAVISIGGRGCWLRHIPPEANELGCIPAACRVVLVGHVHDRWRERWMGDVLLVNVGVDARKFAPLRQDEVVGLIGHCTREKAHQATIVYSSSECHGSIGVRN